MKKLILILIVLSAGSIAGAGEPMLDFPPGKIELPPLSLAEVARQRLAGLHQEPLGWVGNTEPVPAAAPNLALTIIAPRGGMDYKGRIVTPDASIDYKLIVKRSEAAPTK